MWLPHIAKIDLMYQRVVYPGPVVVPEWTTRFRLVIDRENKQTKEPIKSNGPTPLPEASERPTWSFDVGSTRSAGTKRDIVREHLCPHFAIFSFRKEWNEGMEC
ncbi:hypothetical protein TNCV_1231371 [Trichonephila clavipes]|nr:hypothetical protein TNCV_1231371 [Trichonephila clavipes]